MFVAVHVGAGYHSPSKESEYRSLCREACQKAIEQMKSGASAADAVSHAIMILEDSPITNAGIGSNLTEEGSVECDACMMNGEDSSVGAVGCVPGVYNPIEVALLVLRNSQTKLPLGRVPPIMIAGDQARKYAEKNGIRTFDPEISPHPLITSASLKTYQKHSRWYQEALHSSSSKRRKLTDDSTLLNDTVGAICVDINGIIASGVSSGGISLKKPGRVGEAAIPGIGCWAEQDKKVKIGISISGTGEQIMRTNIGRHIASKIRFSIENGGGDVQDHLQNLLDNDFLDNPLLKMYDEKNCGVIILTSDLANDIRELWVSHSTPSMGVGWISNERFSVDPYILRS